MLYKCHFPYYIGAKYIDNIYDIEYVISKYSTYYYLIFDEYMNYHTHHCIDKVHLKLGLQNGIRPAPIRQTTFNNNIFSANFLFAKQMWILSPLVIGVLMRLLIYE